MSITGALVLFAVLWFIVFLIALQIRPHSQDDAGEVEPGTPPGAPADAQILRKVKITTLITLVLWGIIAAIILSGVVSIYDLDWFGRLGPAPAGT